MRGTRLTVRLLPLFAALLLMSGCGDDSTTTSPSSSSTDVVKETFTGTLTVNGAVTHAPITVLTAGTTIQGTLDIFSPDTTQLVGFGLGTWNSAGVCQMVLSNDTATQGTSIVGEATVSGTFCVRVYDSTGTLPGPETYTITVSHQ